MANFTLPTVFPFLLQSQHINFSEWISLFTLLLAPIIAHIVSGIPKLTYLSTAPSTLPKWHNYLALYNPMTIIWRYAAITNRRLRARRSQVWGPTDIAAANAIFWTSSGWNGSEDIVTRGSNLVHCARLPSSGHAPLLSVDTLQTVIVTLQGLQAIYWLAGGLARTVSLPGMGLDTVSFPVAFLGLTRLYAAVWITSDYEFVARGTATGRRHDLAFQTGVEAANAHHRMPPLDAGIGVNALGGVVGVDARTKNRHSVMEVDKTPVMIHVSSSGGGRASDGEALAPSRFLAKSWPSRIFRVVYMTPLALFWVLSLGFALPGPWQIGRAHPLTNYLAAINGSVAFLVMMVMYVYYWARLGCGSTVLPCIGKPWFKVLVCMEYTFMLSTMVISALETRRAPCGVYTTMGKEMDPFVYASFDSS